MTTEDAVVNNPQHENTPDTENHSEIKNYHDSFDISGSLFKGHVSFTATKEEKSFIDLSNIPMTNVRSWHGYTPDLTQITQKLLDEGVLFLGGEIGQLDQLARTLAWHVLPLLNELQEEPQEETKDLKIFEWKGLERGRGVVPLVENECENGVVILPLLKPEHINFNYSSLYDLSNHSRKIIVTSSLDTEHWQRQLNTSRVSVETPSYRQLFTSSQRSDFISRIFSESEKNKRLNSTNLDASISPKNAAFTSLCESLGDFDSIHDFIERIAADSRAQNVELRDAQILAEELNDDLNRLVNWYDTLKPKDQLLCLLASIFNSVAVEQLLELAELIVAHVWRPMQGSLAVFDHSDLKSLAKYFNVQDFGQGVEKLETVNFQVPVRVLDHAWHNQRRYLLALVPLCVDIVEESVKVSATFNYILYGSPVYRESIRRDISKYLFWIGDKQTKTIETPLLQVLSIDSYDARLIAANTLSMLYTMSNSETILQLLNNWNYRAAPKERLLSLIPRFKNNGYRARECLQVTIILTITEIFRHSTTEELSTDLLDLFIKILNWSPSKEVHAYIERYFLPYFYMFHFTRANDFTEDFIARSPLSDDSIAYAISQGEYYSPMDLKAYFEEQLSRSRQSTDRDKKSTTNRIKFLSVALDALGLLEYSKNRVLSVHEAFEIVSEVLDEEHHAMVRNSALRTLVLLSSTYSEVVDEKFQHVIQSLTNQEREMIAEHLYKVYIDERRARTDGEEKLTIGEERFPVWIDTERPKMPIEATLSQWLEGAKTVPSTQLAYKADSLILKFDTLEHREIATFKAERETKRSERMRDKIVETINLDKSNETLSWYSRTISIPMGTRHYAETREAITGILPEALKQSREVQNQMIERRTRLGAKKELPLALNAVLRWERRKPALSFCLLASLIAAATLLGFQLQ